MNINNFIEKRDKFGIKLGLESMNLVMNALGNPQDNVNIIHIAGTNGKGSVLAMLEQVLVDSNYDVCKYTSPYLIDPSEMWQYNLSDVDEQLIKSTITKISSVEEKLGILLTRYELTTAIMFVISDVLKCDYLLLETGLGGRLDATNICKPKYNLITNVEMDHMHILGNTRALIAKEKVAILKTDAYIGQINQDLETTLKEAGIKYQVTSDIDHSYSLDQENFKTNVIVDGVKYEINLYGVHQKYNFLLAYKVLIDMGINKCQIQDSIKKVKWPGRLEVLSNNPLVMYDGAHNESAVDVLIESLNRSIDIYFSSFADKDYSALVEKLQSICNDFYFVQMDEERALSFEQFRVQFPNLDCRLIQATELRAVIDNKKSDSLICGSLNLYKSLK